MSRNPQAARNTAQHAPQALQQQPAADDQPMAEEPQEGYASSTPTSSLTWIAWFCSLPGHEYFSEVTEDFIEDDFNLTGLSAMVPFWKEAMEMVLDVEPEDTHRIPDVSIVEASAELLYGLVHQRYILTRPGLQAMAEKYENGVFGSCLRVYCTSTRLIPCGRSDMPGVDTVKLFCPNCNDIYTPSSSRFSGVDGAFFGTTFAHLFFHTYREYWPAPFTPGRRAPSSPTNHTSPNMVNNAANPTQINPNQYGGQKRPECRVYVPKIYGFKVSERSKSGPRMVWLRQRPATFEELNSVDSRGRWIAEHSDSDHDRNGPAGPGKRGRFDDDDDPDEQIEEDEDDEEDAAPHGPWSGPPPPSAGQARRPVAGGVGGRTRALDLPPKELRTRRRKPVQPTERSSSSSSEDEDECGLETTEDSALDTPAEDGGNPSASEKRGRDAWGRKKRELVAVKLANLMGKDVQEMFSGLQARTLIPADEPHVAITQGLVM